MAGPPKERKLGELMQRVVTRGRLPHATVDFPRYDEQGQAVTRVYLRPLTQLEQDQARANAAAYVQDVLSGKRVDAKWRPEELEDNAVMAEVLALACRDPDDPEKPFFPYGVVETRECTTEELAMLAVDYNNVKERAYPDLSSMTTEEMWAWVRALEEDAARFPFSRVSRSKLEAFSLWAARSLVSRLREDLQAGTTSNPSPASPS